MSTKLLNFNGHMPWGSSVLICKGFSKTAIISKKCAISESSFSEFKVKAHCNAEHVSTLWCVVICTYLNSPNSIKWNTESRVWRCSKVAPLSSIWILTQILESLWAAILISQAFMDFSILRNIFSAISLCSRLDSFKYYLFFGHVIHFIHVLIFIDTSLLPSEPLPLNKGPFYFGVCFLITHCV